jgi:UrcA family protein
LGSRRPEKWVTRFTNALLGIAYPTTGIAGPVEETPPMPRKLNTKAAISIALCALSLVMLGVPARADEATEVLRRVVNFADLDLTRSAGIAALYTRTRWAADEVCEPATPFSQRSEILAHACAKQALDRAIADLNLPQLTSYHLAKIGRVQEINSQAQLG